VPENAALRTPAWSWSARLILSAAYLIALGLSLLVSRAVTMGMTAPDVIDARESQYNDIEVTRRGGLVTLGFRHHSRIYNESAVDLRDPLQLIYPYTRSMMAGLIYANDLRSILDIGFGTGRTAGYVHAFVPNARVTSVELDPDVIDLARRHFGVRDDDRFHVVARDGRMFLAASSERYDVILIDAYRGPFVPFHLLTREFYALAASRLAAGGVIVQNVEPTTMLFDAAAMTIGAVLPNVDAYRAGGNVVLVAYDGAERTRDALAAAAVARQETYGFRYDLRELLRDRRRLADERDAVDPGAAVLTDDFAPVDALKAIQQHNRRWTTRQP
jgi:spermidine synthase